MKVNVLDTFAEGDSICTFCKSSLEEYIKSLDENFMSYDVQRGIVKNVYLDRLVDTVFENKYIPTIVLISSEEFKPQCDTWEFKKFNILDGLQRTYRLKVISDSIDLIERAVKEGVDPCNTPVISFARQYKDQVKGINSNRGLLDKLISLKKDNVDLRQRFDNNSLRFEVWTNLTEKQEIEKMLILNAGHKPVSTRHQLELLFSNLKKDLNDTINFEIVYDKDQSPIQFAKKRKPSQYHFAVLISSLFALVTGKLVTTNQDLIMELQDGFKDEENELLNIITPDLLHNFIICLKDIDNALEKEYGEDGLQWFGREVVLIGIFAVVGRNAKEIGFDFSLKSFTANFCDKVGFLNLESYEKERNSVKLNKVNIGNLNKKAVSRATEYLLENNFLVDNIDWTEMFRDGK